MTEGPDLKSIFREYLESAALAILVALLIRSFVFTAYKIPSSGMVPTLQVGDFVFAYKLPFGVDIPWTQKRWSTRQKPNYGDILVFKHPKDETVSMIKRVVGLPGDRIEIRKGELFLNDAMVPNSIVEGAQWQGKSQIFAEKLKDRTFAIIPGEDDFPPLIIPPDHIFLLGDDRALSDDSRNWGPVPIERIEGRVVLIWMSLEWVREEGKLPGFRFERWFKIPR